MFQGPLLPSHLKWLKNTKERLKTADGKNVIVWELSYQFDDEILSCWAKHFRNNYCFEEEVDKLRDGTGLNRTDYLRQFIFPHESEGFGPAIRAGDFGEILVSDFLEFILGYWVPRTRYNKKDIPNESTKGCDVVGFKIIKNGEESIKDILTTFEVKTQLSGTGPKTRLQDAVNGSANDPTKIGVSLNAIKRRLFSMGKDEDAKRISRFQNPEDRPYREISGAAALFSSIFYDPNLIMITNCQKHPNSANLVLLVIRGDNLMNLVHELYRRAADEA